MYKRYDKYKPSGVEWIKEIPEGWEVHKLKNNLSKRLKYGANEPSGHSNVEHPRYIRITDFGNDGVLKNDTFQSLPPDLAKDYLLEDGDILFARSGATVGKTFIFKNYFGKACFAGYLIKATVNKNKLHNKFLYYFTKSGFYEEWKNSIFIQATIQNIGADKYALLPITIPQLSEQNNIISFLDHKTALINRIVNNRRKQIELLKEERKAVLNQAVTKGINPNVKLVPSGIEWLCDIPGHWNVMKLKYVALLKSGENVTSEEIEEQGTYPIFGGNNIRGYWERYNHDGHYVLIGRQGALCGNINYAQGKFWATEHAVVVHILKGHQTRWLGELLRIMNLNQYSQSAAQPGLAVEMIKNLLIPVPPIEEQKSIVAYIEERTARIDAIISKQEKQISLLEEYRTALISKAVTGQIDVRDWQPK